MKKSHKEKVVNGKLTSCIYTAFMNFSLFLSHPPRFVSRLFRLAHVGALSYFVFTSFIFASEVYKEWGELLGILTYLLCMSFVLSIYSTRVLVKSYLRNEAYYDFQILKTAFKTLVGTVHYFTLLPTKALSFLSNNQIRYKINMTKIIYILRSLWGRSYGIEITSFIGIPFGKKLYSKFPLPSRKLKIRSISV